MPNCTEIKLWQISNHSFKRNGGKMNELHISCRMASGSGPSSFSLRQNSRSAAIFLFVVASSSQDWQVWINTGLNGVNGVNERSLRISRPHNGFVSPGCHRKRRMGRRFSEADAPAKHDSSSLNKQVQTMLLPGTQAANDNSQKKLVIFLTLCRICGVPQEKQRILDSVWAAGGSRLIRTLFIWIQRRSSCSFMYVPKILACLKFAHSQGKVQ